MKAVRKVEMVCVGTDLQKRYILSLSTEADERWTDIIISVDSKMTVPTTEAN